jgi:hypothetical protein
MTTQDKIIAGAFATIASAAVVLFAARSASTSPVATAPAVRAAAVIQNTTVPTPDSGAVVDWEGIIAANTTTGQLRSDLGWRNGAQSEVSGVVHCLVATETAPRWHRVLIAPSQTIVSPTYVSTDCQKAFTSWDSAEAVTDGKWPAAVPASTSAVLRAIILADMQYHDGMSVRQAGVLTKN